MIIDPDKRYVATMVTSHGTSNGSTQYAVTVTASGNSWQVNDIELSTVGQS